MRKFKTCPSEDIVDLDNPETYKHLPDNCKELDNLMLREIGFAISYMDYIHPDVFRENGNQRDGNQRKRVVELIKNFWKNREHNLKNEIWYKEQIFLFQDETENMC